MSANKLTDFLEINNQELVRDFFEYKDGNLYWKKPRGRKIRIGDLAGSRAHPRYNTILLYGKRYKTHRLIFLYHYGYTPKCIDHKDGNPHNNKIENLREASLSQNSYNQKLRKNNTSGFKNIKWHKKDKKWHVELKVDKVQKHFGSYKDVEYANFVATFVRHKYHKEFARG